MSFVYFVVLKGDGSVVIAYTTSTTGKIIAMITYVYVSPLELISIWTCQRTKFISPTS